MSHAAGVGPAVPARGRPGDAPAAGEHAGAGPQRLPAAPRRPAARLPRLGHPPGRAGAGERRRVGRPGAARPPRAAADRPRPGGARTGRSCRRSSRSAEVGLEPLRLEAKEGLALLNGTQMMSAIGALLLADADRLVPDGERRGGDERRGAARHGRRLRRAPTSSPGRIPGQVAVARRAAPPPPRLGRSRRRTTATRHKVQDPYSLRCVPQVHGAVRDALDHLRRVLDIELNSATDNPLVFPGGGVADEATLATGGGRVISGGNFHGEPVALALDFAKLAIAELGSISERRTALLVDPRLNGGLPPFLAGGVRARLRDDDLPVHGGRPGVGEQGPRPPGVGRLDPDERQPGGPRLDGLDRGAARPDGPRARRADRRDRAASSPRRRSTCGSRDRRGRDAGRRRAPRPWPGPGPRHPPRPGPRAGAGPRRRDRARPRGGLGGSRWLIVARLACRNRRLADVTRPSGSSTSPTTPTFAPRSRRAPIPASTTGPATTGRTPTAARRRPGRLAQAPAPPPADAPAGPSTGNPFLDDAPTPASTRSRRLRDRPAVQPVRGRGRTTRSSTTRSRRAAAPARRSSATAPRKLALLGRGLGGVRQLRQGPARRRCRRGVRPVRAAVRVSRGRMRLRELYPQLPDAPLPAVITCIATTAEAPPAGACAAAGRGRLRRPGRPRVRGRRGLSRARAPEDATSAATPDFWVARRLPVAVDDERFPVMRRELVSPTAGAAARAPAVLPCRRWRAIQALGNVQKVRGALIFVEDIESELRSTATSWACASSTGRAASSGSTRPRAPACR